MQVQPLTPSALVDRLVDRLLADAGPDRVRVLLDGAPVTHPGRTADALVAPLRARGRAVLRVSAADFLRPAGVRFEFGRQDPDALLDTALDSGALVREVLAPLGRDGDGSYLPALRDAEHDRSARARRLPAPAGAVLLLDGGLLLGRGLPVEVAVHLAVRPDTLARLTPADQAWRLAAEQRYRAEARPEESADVVVRVDDPRRPAWVVRG
ncbi:MAG TPA: uridine kinase [Cellulomonas sp.]